MPPAPSPRLFLIDGYALIYRSFFAYGAQPLVNSKGENTSIARGAHDFLKKLIEKHKPEYLGWVHDAGLSFRHERYPAYKATRERLEPAMQDDFDRGVERITQILGAFKVPVLSLDGYEADDVIGTLVKKAAAQDLNAVIVSGDKDFVQLMDRKIWILNPWHGRPGFTSEKWYDLDNAPERLGVPPNRVTDYLALLGDTSDNVPGVKGIGEKTAHALIEKWGPLESILAHVSEVEPTRARNALTEFGANGVLSKELVTIRDDLDIALDLDALAMRPPDWNRLRDLFVELEFRGNAQEAATHAEATTAPAVPAAAPSKAADLFTAAVPAAAPAVSKSYRVVDTAEGVTAFVALARKAPFIAIDIETVLDAGAPPIVTPLRANVVGISVSIGPGEAVYLPFAHRQRETAQGDLALGATPKAAEKAAASSIAARVLAEGPQAVKNLPSILSAEMEPLRALLADPKVKKVAENGKYDRLVLRRAKVALAGLDFDLMLASFLLDPGRRSHELDVLALEFLQLPMTGYDELAGKGKNEIPFDEVPITAARDYACAAADLTFRLRQVLEPKLAEVEATMALLRDVELPLIAVLAEMEWHGITIDLPWFHSLKSRFMKERGQVEKQIYEAAGEEFNVASNKQLAAIMFGKLGMPVKKKTSTGPSTDVSVLQELADEGHVLPTLLMEYRELSKLENTYLDILPALVNPADGRLHTSYSQTVASTGRLSSSDPNLQNIPIRRQLGKDIRRGFIPQAGWTMLAADYSQIELRLLAHLSHDAAFVDAFRAGGDIHRQTASIIFGVPIADVTSEMRGRAKTINFATIYGQGAHSLSRQIKVEHAEAKAFIDTYFERFAGVRKFLDASVEQAVERGYVETIFKRRRYIPELKDRNFNIRAFGERVAQNSPIQGSAADLIKVAMIKIHHALIAKQLESRMLLQVHDELVFECPSGELDELQALVVHEMTTAVKLEVPLVVDVGTGVNWLETKL
ncbi:MAG: DNA polymerase I [Gemmatimonadaceae bacterium]